MWNLIQNSSPINTHDVFPFYRAGDSICGVRGRGGRWQILRIALTRAGEVSAGREWRRGLHRLQDGWVRCLPVLRSCLKHLITHTLLSSYHRRWRRRHREHRRTHSDPAALPGQSRAQSPHHVAGHDRRGVTSLQTRFGPLFHSLLLYLRHFQDWLIEFLSCKSRLSTKYSYCLCFR